MNADNIDNEKENLSAERANFAEIIPNISMREIRSSYLPKGNEESKDFFVPDSLVKTMEEVGESFRDELIARFTEGISRRNETLLSLEVKEQAQAVGKIACDLFAEPDLRDDYIKEKIDKKIQSIVSDLFHESALVEWYRRRGMEAPVVAEQKTSTPKAGKPMITVEI